MSRDMGTLSAAFVMIDILLVSSDWPPTNVYRLKQGPETLPLLIRKALYFINIQLIAPCVMHFISTNKTSYMLTAFYDRRLASLVYTNSIECLMAPTRDEVTTLVVNHHTLLLRDECRTAAVDRCESTSLFCNSRS